MLHVEKINKRYGSNVILDDVSLDVAPGEITAVIGPSGSGKTTLLRVMSLLESPDSGSISIDGQVYSGPAATHSPPPWPNLTVVFQQLFLWPHLTLRQNIELPQRGDRIARDLTNHLLKVFSLTEAADKYPNQTSLGQRQRAALIRAIGLRPRYLLLDEITSALDVEHVAIVLSQLDTLRQQGVGMLLVTHLIGFAADSADKVVFLHKGQVAEKGGADILKNPTSDRLKRFLSLVRSAV